MSLPKRKRHTKSQRSRNTKKLKEFAHTSKKLEEAVVDGVSMWPVLRHGYIVYFKRMSADKLNIGDIAIIRSGQKYLVHRILARVGPFFVEAGDNSYSASLVLPSDIIGKVLFATDTQKNKIYDLTNPKALQSYRTLFFVNIAHGFIFLHEAKDRLIGNSKSKTLWRLSQAYRHILTAAGLRVPTIFPRT